MNASPSHADDSSPKEFRLYLQEELVRRCKKNPRFSLRAFARTLDVEASALSKILNGKRTLTPKMLHRMCTQLGLGPDEVRNYESGLVSTRRATRTKPDAKRNFQQVTADMFNAIADWYHYAIIELLTVQGFRPSATWIARALGVSVPEVNFAVERLLRLGMLEITPEGQWVQRSGQLTTTGSDYSTAAFRKLQKQILEQAIDALETVPWEDRDQSSMTMAVSKPKLNEARERIKAFRRDLCAFLQDGSSHDEVYQLSISMFPVTRTNRAAAADAPALVAEPVE